MTDGQSTLKIVSIYYAVGIVMLLSGYLGLARTEAITNVPIVASILLLFPLYVWQRDYRQKTKLPKETSVKDKSNALLWILSVFILALSVRIPSVLLFGEPYEKTPLIFFLVLTVLVVERTDLSAFGFRTENLGKSLLYGFAFFAILAGLMLTITYALVYGFVNQVPVLSFNFFPPLLAMPFMTLCVGISEEGLFRGYMQTHLGRVYNPKTAILVQAVLFGVWHFVWNLSPLDLGGMAQYVITTFFMGLLFGYFYHKTENLVPLIFAHGLWDSVPQGIVENASVMNTFSAFPALTQAFVLVVPFAISAFATVAFMKFFVRKV